MKKTLIGCTLILSAALVWGLSLVSASISLMSSVNGWGVLGRYWTNYFESGGVPITIICIVLFIVGLSIAPDRVKKEESTPVESNHTENQ
jgi:hypothetical protein